MPYLFLQFLFHVLSTNPLPINLRTSLRIPIKTLENSIGKGIPKAKTTLIIGKRKQKKTGNFAMDLTEKRLLLFK